MLDTRETLEIPAPAPVRHRTRSAAVAALLVVLLAELAVRAMASRLPEPSAWPQRAPGIMVEQMKALGGADAVFIGSSVVGNAFDPALFEERTGLSAYNSGLQRAGIEGVDRWVREFVVPTLKPKVAVLGLVSRDLNDNGPLQQAHLEEYLSSPGRAAELGTETAAMRAERVAADISALVRYRRYLRRPFDLADHVVRRNNALEPPVQLGPRGEPLGADANAAFHIPEWPYPHRNGELLAFDMTRSLKILEGSIAYLRAEGIDVVLVDMPVIEEIYVPYHPGARTDFLRYERAVRGLATRLNVPLFVPDDSGWDPAVMSVDDIHLTRAGAARLTQEVAHFLRKRNA